MKLSNKKIMPGLFIIASYLLIIVFRGFNYASGDVVDVMSYARYLQDNQLYNFDFYIQNISKIIPNERFIFSSLLSLMGSWIRFLPFIIHSVCIFIFIYFLYKIASLYIKSISLIFLMILTLLIPFAKVSLGGNELYYNMFIASFVAKVFGMASLYFFLTKRFTPVYILIIIATLIHPTVGIQLFIIYTLTIIFDDIISRKPFLRERYTGMLFYIITAGVYVLILFMKVESKNMNDDLYFEIFEFRNAHHFFPQYFPVSAYMVEGILIISGIFIMIRNRMNTLLRISLIILSGAIVYSFGVLVIKSDFILGTQWFKATIWLELVSLIAIFKFADELRFNYKLKSYNNQVLIIFIILTLAIVPMIFFGNKFFVSKPYEFAYGMNISPEEDIGILAKKYTPKNATFIYPVEFTGFKVYSERSAYIDFKSVVHRKDALPEWYSRIKEVYGIDIKDRRSGVNMFEKAGKNYSEINNEKLKILSQKGVDYIVQYSHVEMKLPILTQNREFKIYKLSL
jgi:hypothetical protein